MYIPYRQTAYVISAGVLSKDNPAFISRADSTEANPTEGTYACVLSDATYLYRESSDATGLFLIPEHYFVKVTAIGVDYCVAEYGDGTTGYPTVTGYCKTKELSFVDFIPKCPYASATFDLTYRLEGSIPSLGDALSVRTVKATYYGDYRVGSTTYCYVYADGEFGYVPKPELTIEPNTEYVQSEEPVSPPTRETTDAIPLICLAGIALLAVLIVFLRTKRTPVPDFDE
ncbi:MAG: hypothetical protein ACI4U2_03100 [Christensenellaceae bacterium]